MSDPGKTLAKYIRKIQSGRVGILSFAATGGSGDITATLTSTLATAGDGGVSVPLQVSTAIGIEGVITQSPLNRVPLRIADASIDDGTGLEVYGRITEAAGTYTLTYYVNDAGTEVAHSFGASTDVDVYIPYRYTFGTYPTDSLIKLPAFDAIADPTPTVTPIPVREALSVTAANVLSALTNTPFAGTSVEIVSMGIGFSEVESPAPFTVAGTTITWNATNAGVSLSPTEDTLVYANYYR